MKSDESGRFNLLAAIEAVLGGSDSDQYCVAKMFAAQNSGDWNEIAVTSLKLGRPIAPEGGATFERS